MESHRGQRLLCREVEVRSSHPGSRVVNVNVVPTEAVVRFTNKGPTNMSVHVHGQYNRAPFDGWAGDYALPGQYKVGAVSPRYSMKELTQARITTTRTPRVQELYGITYVHHTRAYTSEVS